MSTLSVCVFCGTSTNADESYRTVAREVGRMVAREKMRLVEKVGVTTEFLPKKLPARAYRWVVDATGSAEGLRAAVTMCEPRGTVIMKSTVHGLVTIDTAPVIVNEITLVGSRCGRFEPAMELLRLGTVCVESLIADRFPLSQAPQAFARAAEKGVLKVLLEAE